MDQTRILVSWRALTRDRDLFDRVAKNSGNTSIEYSSPEVWDNIRYIGNINYFDQISNKFFHETEFYPSAIETISKLCGNVGTEDKLVYIIFDERPKLLIDSNNIVKQMSVRINDLHGKVNGFYVSTDKIGLCKQIGASVFIDDDPRILIPSAAGGIKSILLLRSWNRFLDVEKMYLATSKERSMKIQRNIAIAEDWIEVDKILHSSKG